MKEKLLRARADYDNLVKRQQRDAALERERVKARVLENFLQVYEYGRMAAAEAEKQPGPLAEGIKMVVREFDRMLDLEGVRPTGVVGEPFDPRLHEAIDTVTSQETPHDHIERVAAPGYLLGERVLRYAKVVVARTDSDAEE